VLNPQIYTLILNLIVQYLDPRSDSLDSLFGMCSCCCYNENCIVYSFYSQWDVT